MDVCGAGTGCEWGWVGMAGWHSVSWTGMEIVGVGLRWFLGAAFSDQSSALFPFAVKPLPSSSLAWTPRTMG